MRRSGALGCFDTVISMRPTFVEEPYMEGPAAWGDEWPENPPIYEAVDT
jgi:hypothetical protein